MIKKPYLVQRCKLVKRGDEEMLTYDYMGSAEFEFGSCPKSLKRIFAAGIEAGTVDIQVGGKTVKVYMFAGKGFDFDAYVPWLQKMADDTLRMKECSEFRDVVGVHYKVREPERYHPSTNAWFDIRNDVLWTLMGSQGHLERVLKEIQALWAENAGA